MPRCHFCELEAHGPCMWPVDQFVEAEASELQAGDVVRRQTHKENDADEAWRMAVREVSPIKKDLLRVVVVIKSRAGQSVGGVYTFEVNTFSRIRILRKAPCGQQVCERHVIARGPGKYLCPAHWTAWEKVA